jgi:acetyl esterase/lipase
VTGDRVLAPPFDTTYINVGAFFAHQGFIVIIPDYRLASPPMSAQYPKPVEDIRDSVQWSINNRDKLISSTTPNPDTDSIFLLGHSAGATHVASLVFDTQVLPVNSPLRLKIKGVIPFTAVYYNDARTVFEHLTKVFYGDKLDTHCILTLLKSAESNGLKANALPKLLIAEAEFEPPILREIRENFQSLLETYMQQSVPVLIAKGHNHLSIYAALSSGQGEEWALEVSEWICRTRNGDSNVEIFERMYGKKT